MTTLALVGLATFGVCSWLLVRAVESERPRHMASDARMASLLRPKDGPRHMGGRR